MLQNAGQSIDNIDDYDLSEISLNEDGTAKQILMEGRRSAVYGCYIEETKPEETKPAEETKPEEETKVEEPTTEDTTKKDEALSGTTNKTDPEETTDTNAQTLAYEDEDVTITASADEKGIIPEGAALRVVPILPQSTKNTIADTMDETDQTSTKALSDTVDEEKSKEAAALTTDLIANTYEEVKKQLEEKAANEEYDIAGFLAYDISFIDKDGKEVEPNGNVKVTIDYKQEAIPADVDTSEDADLDVTVMHLEENSSGKVNDVVDMVADTTKEATVETTDSSKVKKAEFVTDSFSVFTVTWKGGISASFNLQLIDQNGNDIGGSITDKTIDYGTNIAKDKDIEAIAEKLGIKTITYQNEEYHVIGAKVVYQANNQTNEKYITSLVKWSGNVIKDFHGVTHSAKETTIRCKTNNTEETVVTSEDTVCFIYRTAEDTELSEVATVDSNAAGITIEMFDYEKAAALGAGEYGNGSIKSGILNNKINEGSEFPTLAKGKTGTSLSKWFTSGGAEVQTSVKANHLFLKSEYNASGYYYYSSFENYAKLNNNGNFSVYNQIGTPDNTASYFYQRGNFMPYNSIVAGNFSTNKNLYDEYGNALNASDESFGNVLFKTQGVSNYFFGMYMHADFAQLAGGQYNGSDMIYEFNGDDDLWIYIDGVLVLDIGGIHDAHSGSINFATGVVTISDCTTGGTPKDSTTTIKEMFAAADASTEGFNGNTFADYTTHKIQMFYMERGAYASNLKMKVNLPTIPEGTVQVQKELSNTDKEKYANVKFGFKFHLEDLDADGNGLGTYSIYKAGNVTLKDGTIVNFDEDGTFYLKPEQMASFPNLKVNQKYYVEEVNVKSDEFDEIRINGTVITEDFTDGSSNTIYSVVSGKDTVSNRPYITFTNNCSEFNKRELKIIKKLADGQQTSDTFSFKIWLEGQSGTMVPYVGSYYLKDAEGKYYKWDSGSDKLIECGSDIKDAQVCGNTNAEGIVSGVPVGYTVVITQILSGTDFFVEEVDLNSELYDAPSKEVDSSTCDITNQTATIDGTIELRKDAQVTITNKLKVNHVWRLIKRSKTNSAILLSGAKFKLAPAAGSSATANYYGLSQSDDTTTDTVIETGIVNWYYDSDCTQPIISSNPIGDGEYALSEIEAPAGYAMSTETGNITIESGKDITITGLKSEVVTDTSGSIPIVISTIYFDDAPLYELPSSGGIGIYWYLIGGVLLMIAAALILYRRNKYGEVLER